MCVFSDLPRSTSNACVCSMISQEAQAMLYHAHQSSVFNGGKMRQPETRAHRNSEFNMMLCLAYQVNERRRAIK